MSIEKHIHALPRKTQVDTLYPEGVLIWDKESKRILVGDGTTPNGVAVAMEDDINFAYSHTNIQLVTSVTAKNEAVIKGEVLITHIISPSGTIYVLTDGVSYWSNGYTYLLMSSYITKAGMLEFEGTWKIAYQPIAK